MSCRDRVTREAHSKSTERRSINIKKTYIESGRQRKEIKVSTDTHEPRTIARPLLRR
jgi:hypothetical protein